MFKKLKDKLAEEVKSSPQRIQQFAQAAQAAVTSASSSISDITNNDLFSIGDNDNPQSRPVKPSSSDSKNSTSAFQEVTLVQPGSHQTSMDSMDFSSAHDLHDTSRQRRLSNSSFASDVSFRLPSYESPSMYHLQSDMEVSASEAEERGFSSGNVSLDRVTKEQIYAAYRRTQERYTKYRTQYADLARHYKLLERDNAKARSVLVETQDKALRRISELREQCALEQSAKAHLEKALRVDIEEKNMIIDTLNTKIKLLQNNSPDENINEKELAAKTGNDSNSNVQLISFDTENNHTNDDIPPIETQNLSNKIEKLEMLVAKYKESLKTTKEKNAQLTTEIQILSAEIENKNKDVDQLKQNALLLDEAKRKIQELNDTNEELQNKINVYDFNRNKEMTTLELDYQKAQEEIAQLQSKINVFSKREEEYAISLAENKLSIHKELESKEAEIKSLKDRLTESRQEIQSLDIVLSDYKNKTAKLEDECSKLKKEVDELNSSKLKITELETQIQLITQKYQATENMKTKADEEYKCLQLQLKQETAEKLAMIDRNTYLENRITQLTEENSKKTLQVKSLEKELYVITKEKDTAVNEDQLDKVKYMKEIDLWKSKYSALESEIQEEREELGKLQSEIEKLLANDELLQIQNSDLNDQVQQLKSENMVLSGNNLLLEKSTSTHKLMYDEIKNLKQVMSRTSVDVKALKEAHSNYITQVKSNWDRVMNEYKELDMKTQEQTRVYQIEIDEMAKQESRAECQELQKFLEQEKNEQNVLKQKINDLKNEINSSENVDDALKNENKELNEKLEELDAKCKQLQDSLNCVNDEKSNLNKSNTTMAEQIKKLEHDIESLHSEKQSLTNESDELKAKCEILQDIVNRNNNDQTTLKEKITNLENAVQLLQNEKQKLIDELTDATAKCEILQDIINRNNNDQTLLKESIQKLEKENNLQKDQFDQLQIDLEEKIKILKEENEVLINKSKHFEDSNTNIQKLQQTINDLSKENISLRNQSEEITNSINHLEIELREVRKSHTEIEQEKDHLNSIIEQLESKQTEYSVKDTQTDAVQDVDTEPTCEKVTLTSETSQVQSDEYGALKEENKRLQSDISGLQTYLAKISKENSVLNDKLRELMASSENSHDNTNENLLNDVQLNKDKLDDLVRENNLLIEENLELKDQLNSQHYAKQEPEKRHENGKDMEYLTLKEKYTSLLDINNRLEKRMLDLEQMNNSVNGSMTQMQQQNEKLRLTNEKLERRLDEALVSLRHLHALQENTELEYLKNILYEYLTGTGAHSVTLAKVLAAVVKFDKTQTDAVLQKEKERQGFLRQLGLL
ncbi:GRIP domain-containing protein [Phthorimaea operculella]|nr:GRIP domain-containing protein [Phthorimaea operculella]